MSSTALRAGGILRALTDDHPQSLRGSPPGPATTDVLRTTILLLACQLDFAYKQLSPPAGGGKTAVAPRRTESDQA